MWKWKCPAQPKLVFEHHSLESANQSILGHLLGFTELNIAPCPLDAEAHAAEDDGVPCDWERSTKRGGLETCRIPYIPAEVKLGRYGRRLSDIK